MTDSCNLPFSHAEILRDILTTGPFVDVALPTAPHQTFTYLVPEHLKDAVQVGQRVLVPFRSRREIGYVATFATATGLTGVKEVATLVDEDPLFDVTSAALFLWMANYYHYPIAKVITACLPPGLDAHSYQAVRLTETGKMALQTLQLDPTHRSILEDLNASRSLPIDKCLAAAKTKSRYDIIYRLRDQGLVAVETEFKSDRVKISYDLEICLIDDSGQAPGIEPHPVNESNPITETLTRPPEDMKHPAQMSRKEQAVFDLIRASGRIMMSELKKRSRTPEEAIRSLEARHLVSTRQIEIYRNPLGENISLSPPPTTLSPHQRQAIAAVKAALNERCFAPFLLHGVTGSGKTEVYLALFKEVLDQGRQGILLVPEIALVSQLEGLLRSRFRDRVAILSSALTPAQKYSQWLRLKNGQADIAVGPRSALFAPLNNLGLIVVDEEHDDSYKQGDRLRYHARDVALVKGALVRVPVILGSATPAVTSFYQVRRGRYQYLLLPERIKQRPLPEVILTPMKGEKSSLFSEAFRQALQENRDNQEQALIFVNRRGFIPVILCPRCGQAVQCPNCQVSLTHHLEDDSLHCHYCQFTRPLVNVCSKCGKKGMSGLGFGTEKVEQELKKLFPQARVARMDRDTTTQPGALFKILKNLREGKTDILVGTQMIVKGHDFPGVTLVGIISADQALCFPDFRASERTFQVLSQVAGRAGRGERPGRVIVQTYNPQHFAITCARDHDYISFFEREFQFRSELAYPPLSRLLGINISGNDPEATRLGANAAGRFCRELADTPEFQARIKVLGPTPCPLFKLKNRYRWQILIKSPGAKLLNSYGREINLRLPGQLAPSGIRVTLDVDPMDMM
ncbi:MAG: primosomal protein N' [Deltaproteobacteria bacterium]|nr:primosomal protein N' [Deltaproteobacteria bacterium]